MKRLLIISAVVMLASSISMAAILDSAHDLSTGTTGIGSEICVFCHTPHQAQAVSPLWNHTLSSATYVMYGSGSTTLQNAPTIFDGGDNVISALCLSCHDGTVAVGSIAHNYDNTAGANLNGYGVITGDGNVGTNLANDHPINMTYGGTGIGLNDATTITSVLYGDTVQCASCHEVHNESANGFLLRVANTNSDLCTDCHNK
ncbi:MAG: cytochrome c3 family protein [Acidobacteria bacterium]|uniref:Cytochrome c3 family protein n=1 Tax=Candidatus Polarisedimenticola svalbardensis TaxID=2886004 RepID=A0A8J6Y2A8_9BACT|nr:cytochrome c3 family protein [Candidatus Polarisedimenticola svalbardensis]